MDSTNGIAYYLNKCQSITNTSQMTFFLPGRQHTGAHALCTQYSPTAVALSTFFLLNHAPSNSPELSALITRFRESYSSVSMSRDSWVKKTEEIKERLVEFWQCNDTAFEWKMRFSCFPVLLSSGEAHVIWGGTIKHLLTAYFIGNISAKKYQNAFACVKVTGNQR